MDSSTAYELGGRERPEWRTALLGTLGFAALAVAGLAWAKWLPYLHKLRVTGSSGVYAGHDLLAKAGSAGAPPSLARAWTFTKAYALAIWPALVAALLIGAGVETLLPRRWLLRAMGADGARGTFAGAIVSLPSMMCTCCSAPVVWSLRRAGVPARTALAYWLGNPVLNPAVLAILAIVFPWQWVATRLVVGVLLVYGASCLVTRVGGRAARAAPRPSPNTGMEQLPPSSLASWPSAGVERSSASSVASWPSAGMEQPSASSVASPAEFGGRRFAGSLLRLAVVLLPEYLVVVLLVGLFRGWMLPVGQGATHLAVLVTLLAAVAGTLVVVPTAGEVPLLAGLAAAGMARGPLGALLLTLPAVSLPSMAMVGRAMGWRVTAATAVAVAFAGVLAGALLWSLSA